MAWKWSSGLWLLPGIDSSSIDLPDLPQSAPEQLGQKWVKGLHCKGKAVNGKNIFTFPLFILFLMKISVRPGSNFSRDKNDSFLLQ